MTIFQLSIQWYMCVILYESSCPVSSTGQHPGAHSLWEYAIQVCEVHVMLQLHTILHAYKTGGRLFCVHAEEENKGLLPSYFKIMGGGGVGG